MKKIDAWIEILCDNIILASLMIFCDYSQTQN